MTPDAVTSARREAPIRPRDPGLQFKDVPRHWMAGASLPTQIANGVNLLFPAGERFFVRSVRHYADAFSDPAVRAKVLGFAGQEVRHARAHETFFDQMREHGYEIDGFLRVYEKIAYGWIEPNAPPALRLAVTAAAEHYTALLGEHALLDGMLDQVAHPTMARLMKWHAAEEIEHRAVAFDVLQQVDPRLRTRVAGMLVATVLLGGFWAAATVNLLWQDRRLGTPAGANDLKLLQMDRHSIVRDVFLKGMKMYFKRDFHPLNNGHIEEAERYLREAGLEVTWSA